MVLLSAAATFLIAQERQLADSLLATIPDSLKPSFRKQPFMVDVGIVTRPSDTLNPLHRHQFRFTDAVTVNDLISRIPGVFLRTFGEAGQADQLSIAGIGPAGVSILIDGRPINDIVHGGVNLYDIPLEYVGSIEPVNGPRSLVFGGSSPGGTLNIASQQYSTNRPRTKLRFFQGAFEHILTDGMFTQNVSRGMNALVGIQRHVSDGRYSNAAYDSWNVRARLRYDPTEHLSLWISELYSRSSIGLNGGVDPSRSPSLYDDVTASVVDNLSYQIREKHDLTLGLTGAFLSDTTQRTNALLYHSAADREYSIGGGTGAPPTFTNIQGSALWGGRLGQELRWSLATIVLGAQFEYRSVGQTRFLSAHSERYAAVMGSVSLRPVDWLKTEAAARQERLRSASAFSWSVGAELTLAGGLTLTANVGVVSRFPTIQELLWKDSILTRTSDLVEERHQLTEIGLHAKTEYIDVSAIGFLRKTENLIALTQIAPKGTARSLLYSNIPSAEITGVKAGTLIRLWRFNIEGQLMYASYKAQGRAELRIPEISSIGEISFRDEFFSGDLNLKLGVRWRLATQHLGQLFVPRMLATAAQSTIEMPAFAALDVFVVAQIGSACLALTLENPLNTNTMMLPYYPLMNRNLKLGVNWEFTD